MVCGLLAIGGVGGSGTRVVARISQEVGCFLGNTLNDSLDNLEYTKRFKRKDISSLPDVEFNALAQEFSALLREEFSLTGYTRCGWKEPNTHVSINRLLNLVPELSYIHVFRNGLDMALSKNQSQTALWGEEFVGHATVGPINPRYSLKYWCAVHRRMEELAKLDHLRSRIHFLNFDRLVLEPKQTLRGMFAFMSETASSSAMETLEGLISNPFTANRWRLVGKDAFDKEDFDFCVRFMKDRGDVGELYHGQFTP